MEIKHLGSGVVVFDNAIEIDDELISGYIKHLRQTGATEVFTEQKDDWVYGTQFSIFGKKNARKH